MPFEFQMGDDAAVFDGLETVALLRPGDEEATTAVALKRPLTLRELELSGGAYLPGDVRFHFSAAALVEEPMVGTVITDGDGRTWTVIEMDDGVLGARCTCTARPVGG